METGAFRELHSEILEMAVGRRGSAISLPSASKNLGNRRPGDDGADRGHGHPGEPRPPARTPRSDSPGSCTGSRNHRRRRRWPRCRRCRAPVVSQPAADNGMLGASMAADTPDAAHSLARSPGKTIGHIHRRTGVIANRLRQRRARLRHPIAPDQHLPCRRIVSERRGDGAASEDIETERGVADRSRHHHAVAGFRAAAMDHPARGHAPERRDRDHQRPRRRNRIAAQQRAAELRRILAKPARERRQPGIVGGRAAPASAQSPPASHPSRRDRTDSPAAPCARSCRADRRAENARPRRWRPWSPRYRRPIGCQDRRVVAETERAGIGRDAAGNSARSASLHRMPVCTGSRHVSRLPATNSSARNWRAIWSSTAFTMPVSSPSTKACATSTYSDTTTRAGTSLRCSSS